MKKKILFSLACAVLAFGLPEAFLRIAFSRDWVLARMGSQGNACWRLLWANKHKSGTEIYYKFDVYDPTKGWFSKPNLRNVKVFGDKTLSTNSRGLRGNREYAYGKNSEKLRILFFGDSYTFGDEVSDDETYPSRVQEMLPQAEVVNMGVHGYGHDQMLILLKEEGIRYKPDIVVLGFVYIDMPRNVLSFRDYAKPMFVVQDGKLVLTNSPVPRPEDVLKWDWARPRIYDFLSILGYHFSFRAGLYEKEINEVTAKILDEMVRTIDEIGATPVFVYLPYDDEIRHEDNRVGEEYFQSYCKSNGNVDCFSVRPCFSPARLKGRKLLAEGHWTPGANRAVARGICDYFAQKKYFNIDDSPSE